MVKVGIGITTMDREHCLNALLESIRKHTFIDNLTIFVNDDSMDKEGVAKSKNNCLRALKDCDYIFLLDDDVKIIRDGWIEYCIEMSNQYGMQHQLLLNERFHRLVKESPKFKYFDDCGGVFMFLTKWVLKEVGAFNEDFEKWGLEHAEYSLRIQKAFSYPYKYCMPKDLPEYIYSEDYSNPNHQSSITNEEKNLLFRKNFPKFAKGIDKIYIPL